MELKDYGSFVNVMRRTKNYKRFVGNEKHYFLIGKIQFEVLMDLGLKENHTVLDVGCGSLRAGIFLLDYLESCKYYGIEPEKWLIDEAINKEVGILMYEDKKPRFDYNNQFNLDVFNIKFDYIIANSIFIHACEKQILKILDEVVKIMHKDSIFVFNYIQGEDNKLQEWSYPSHITYSYDFIANELNNRDLIFNFLDCQYPGKQKMLYCKLREALE